MSLQDQNVVCLSHGYLIEYMRDWCAQWHDVAELSKFNLSAFRVWEKSYLYWHWVIGFVPDCRVDFYIIFWRQRVRTWQKLSFCWAGQRCQKDLLWPEGNDARVTSAYLLYWQWVVNKTSFSSINCWRCAGVCAWMRETEYIEQFETLRSQVCCYKSALSLISLKHLSRRMPTDGHNGKSENLRIKTSKICIHTFPLIYSTFCIHKLTPSPLQAPVIGQAHTSCNKQLVQFLKVTKRDVFTEVTPLLR